MGNELKGLPQHSAEFFGDTRDFWWNDDYVHFLISRWQLADVRSVLDVGSGVGHWSRVLARALSPAAHITGLDREPVWVEKAKERAQQAGLGERLHYQVGQAAALPFPDRTFDLVTCQTLLIHVPDPQAVLREMVRVTRPGGRLLVAEPTNVVGPLVDSVAMGDSPEVCAALLKVHLICTQGKKALGEGDDLLGERLPQQLAAAGVRDVEVRLNERPWVLVPPYASSFEHVQLEEVLDLAERGIGSWGEDTTRRYYLAGGGDEASFAAAWELTLDQLRRTAAEMRAQRFTRAGAGLFYVACGRVGGDPS